MNYYVGLKATPISINLRYYIRHFLTLHFRKKKFCSVFVKKNAFKVN